jgi:hypothetical protein
MRVTKWMITINLIPIWKQQRSKSLLLIIGAFRLAGYSVWNGEAAGSNPVSYTEWSVRLMARTQDFHSCNTGSTPVQITALWLNRNKFLQHMHSWLCAGLPNRRGSVPCLLADKDPLMLLTMPDGVMATYHTLTVMFSVLPIIIGMSLATKYVGFSLMVKHPSVQRKIRVLPIAIGTESTWGREEQVNRGTRNRGTRNKEQATSNKQREYDQV